MTTQTSDVYSEMNRSADSDEIDLRRYLLILLRWWREILAISILAGAIAAIAVMLLNSRQVALYSASADLVLTGMSSVIELDSRVSTSFSGSQNDINTWRTSLLELAKSGVVATAVIDELGDELPPGLRSIEALVSVVNASIPTSSDER